MTRSWHILLIPMFFFGYAMFVNLAVLLGGDRPKLSLDRLHQTGYLDSVYAEAQPHRGIARGLWGALRFVLFAEAHNGVVVGPNGWLFSQEELRPALPAEQQKQFHDIIAQSADKIWASGGQLIVLILPTKAETLGLPLASGVVQTRIALGEALRANSVPFLDAGPAMASGQDLFFRTDTHWTLKGSAAVATYLAQSFPSLIGTTEFQVTDLPAQSFSGDLVPFVTTAALAPHIGLSPELLPRRDVTPVQSGDIDLFGPAGGAAHVLVGTSYSANDHWGFTDALKLALGMDVLNYASEGRGPFQPMQDYLATLDTENAGRTVIWEIPIRYLTDPDLLRKEVVQ